MHPLEALIDVLARMVAFDHRLPDGLQGQRPELGGRAAAIEQFDGPTAFDDEAILPCKLAVLTVVLLRVAKVGRHHFDDRYLNRHGNL